MTRIISIVSLVSLAAALACTSGCNGLIGEPGATATDTPPPTTTERRDPGGGPCTGPACVPVDCDGVCIGASGLTRLTRAQYRNAVRDLFGVDVDTTRLPPDHMVAGTFDSNEPIATSTDDVDRYSAVAEDAAAALDVTTLTDCAAGETPDACGARFIETYAARAHRRPLTDADRADYVSLLGWSLDEGDTFDDAIRLVASALLQSPAFLYRVERTVEGEASRLDGFEIAARLSFFLFQTAPDDTLLAAAAAGELDDAAGIEAHARRMLADPKAGRTLRTFHASWLGITDVEDLNRTDESFGPALGRAMRAETDTFVEHVFREANGSMRTLLGADYSFVGPDMARFYGVDAPSGDAPEMRAIPNRRGLLTHASVMAANAADSEADPVYRGKFIRTRVLCQPIGARPDGVDDAVMMREGSIDASMTERERLEVLTSGGECQTCHHLMNGPGFAFSSYDSIGRFRTIDRTGQHVDTSFELLGDGQHSSDANGTYDGAPALVGALAESHDVAACMAVQWMRYALGRDTDDDGTSFAASLAAFDASGDDLRELVIAVTTSDAFRYRLAH